MNAEERYEMLIEYAEGTLPAEQRHTVEALIASSAEMQNDLETIMLAFDSLQVEHQPSVPEHYFSNFTAVLQKNIAAGKNRNVWSVPRFIVSLIKPAAVITLASVFILLFRTLSPAPSHETIYSLVKGFEQSEIAAVIDETPAITVNAAESLLETKLPRESFGIDPSSYQSESEMFAFLEDHEAEQVLAQLQQRGQ
ncbi:MAG: hypothetical protein ACOYNS_00560 [Bacteroidota bacterium]